jgi:hypothetical protein
VRGSIAFWRAACDFVYEELAQLDATWAHQHSLVSIYGNLQA